MSDETNPVNLSPGTSWSRPGMIALSLVIVLCPAALCLAGARVTGQIDLAFVAAPTGVVLAWWMLRLRGEGWADVGLRRVCSVKRLFVSVFAATAIILVGAALLGVLLAATTGRRPDTSAFDRLRGNPTAFAVWLLLVWTTAAFGEEMLMRGFVMHSLHRLMGRIGGNRQPWAWALVVTAVVFGAAHAYQGLAGCILTGIIGCGYGLGFFVCRRNLWAAILTHGAYDTVGFLFVYMSWDKLLRPATLLGGA